MAVIARGSSLAAPSNGHAWRGVHESGSTVMPTAAVLSGLMGTSSVTAAPMASAKSRTQFQMPQAVSTAQATSRAYGYNEVPRQAMRAMPQSLPQRSGASPGTMASQPLLTTQAQGSFTPMPPTAKVPTSQGSFTPLAPRVNGQGSFTANGSLTAQGSFTPMPMGPKVQCAMASVSAPVAMPMASVQASQYGSSFMPLGTASVPTAVATAMPQNGMLPQNGASGRKPLLQAGSIVQIQGSLYQVVGAEPLGMGSFGAVWAATRRDGVKGEVAIKEILCRSQKELGDATLEGRLLRMIHSTKPQHLLGKVPDLVGMETESLGPDQWVMRLAMTKVAGMQLDTFLETCYLPTARGSASSSQLALPSAASAASQIAGQCQSLPGACRFARLLLSQLASTFECMSSVVYHRDVSPHNILIDVDQSLHNPRFGLVDFGLGIDLQSWHGQKGSSSWHYVDIGGDCRYWPVSVWVMFMGGSDELERYPALAQEYQTRLDFHAVGITVLEILLTLLPASALGSEEMRSLHAAWNQYWQHATLFWKRTMQVFDSGQDPSRLKHWIRTEGRVVETLSADIAALRLALRRASDACACAPQGSPNCSQDGARLFRTLLDLVSNGGKVGLEESHQNPSWHSVRSLIDADSMPSGTMTAPAAINRNGSASSHIFSSYPGSVVVPTGSKMQESNGFQQAPSGRPQPAISCGFQQAYSPMAFATRGTTATVAPQYAAVRMNGMNTRVS